jgi:hypothetical protein
MENGLAAALIFAIMFSFAYGIVQMALKHKEAKLRLQQEGSSGPALNAALAEIAALRERVQVLERLATDDDRKLASEIERLQRDQSMGVGR